MSDLKFSDRLDIELAQVEFSAEGRQKVLERVRDRQSVRKRQAKRVWTERIHAFFNTEVKIPVRPLAVALLISVSGLVYSSMDIVGVSAEEMKNSSITVVDGGNGGQANDLYKN